MHIQYEGSLAVLDNLIYEATTGREIYRCGIAVHGGGLCGVYGAAQLAVLYEYGLLRTCKAAVLASTGAASGPFGFTGQARDARKVYWEECCTPRFFSVARYAEGKSVLDKHYLCDDVLEPLFDHSAFRQSETEIFATVTTESGRNGLKDMRASANPMKLVKVSINIPGLCLGDEIIDGERCWDGSGAYPFPGREIIERFDLTDILILANCPKLQEGEEAEQIFKPYLLTSLPSAVRRTFATSHRRFARDLSWLREQTRCRVGILWTDGAVGTFEQDAGKLEAASVRAEEHLSSLLAERSLIAA